MGVLPAGAGKTSLVELRALTKSYPEGGGERVVFRNLSAGIRRGETVALLGRSGSGKSTLLNLIGGIDLPTGGEVILNGTNLTGLSEHRRTLFRRRHIGLIFQSFNLIPTLTVMENLLLPLELNGRTGLRPRATAQDLLGRVGLADRAEAYPDRLSGGEQQRVAVARAVIHDPFLLLADEPTGSLDAETGMRVLELIVGLARNAGRTMIIVTHSEDVARAADRVLAIRDGFLVEETFPGVTPA
ncbi:MAG: transporter related [Deltaproteobacteria bacterium]|nr:transporter related [Deltaproteobacteria bacterium]MBP2686416.1 transporter related [Deltaproteobacteria bacterium]